MQSDEMKPKLSKPCCKQGLSSFESDESESTPKLVRAGMHKN